MEMLYITANTNDMAYPHLGRFKQAYNVAPQRPSITTGSTKSSVISRNDILLEALATTIIRLRVLTTVVTNTSVLKISVAMTAIDIPPRFSDLSGSSFRAFIA